MSTIRGWIELCADVNWEDYHGMWAKKARDGAWFVLQWTNMYDACGERDCKSSGTAQYECAVKRLDLASVDIADALRSHGWRFGVLYKRGGETAALWDGIGQQVVNEHDGEVIATIGDKYYECVLVEACVQHGYAAPIHEECGDIRPTWIRAAARRVAEGYMRPAGTVELHRTVLKRPVNAIGSTAEEFGRGDIDAALFRASGPEADLMRKMYGVPPKPTATKVIHIRTCPFVIMAPEHYDENGVCPCRDAAHRAMMIEKWGYSEQSFIGKGVI